MRVSWFTRAVLLASLAGPLGCESSTAPQDAAGLAPLLATASLSFIPNAAAVGLTYLPATVPRAIDPPQCAFAESMGRFSCAPYSILISQAFTGFSDTLGYELLDASGASMRVFDPALTVAVRTYAAVEYVTQSNGTQLPGDLHQTFTSRRTADGNYLIDGTQIIHASQSGRFGVGYKIDTLNVTITGVEVSGAGRAGQYPLSGTVQFLLRQQGGFRLGTTVTFNGTSTVPVVYLGDLPPITCTWNLAGTTADAMTCAKP